MRHALWYGHGSFMGLQIHAPELTTSLNQFEEAIDLLSGLTPLEMTFQLISQNMFYGMLMAIPTALIVMRKKKNE